MSAACRGECARTTLGALYSLRWLRSYVGAGCVDLARAFRQAVTLSGVPATRSLAARFDPRQNAFGFLRLFFASLVIVHHTCSDEPWPELTPAPVELGKLRA